MQSKIGIKDYLIHGIFFTIYGLVKYVPSPLGDPLRYIIAKSFMKKMGKVRIYEGVTLWYPYHISMGDRVTLNEWVYISGFGQISIGNDVRIGHRTSILSSDHVFENSDQPIHQQGLCAKPVVIEDNVFIGCNVTIMGGVRIGEGSVIGAGAVVTKNIEPGSIVVGNPCRIIKNRI